MDAVKAVQCRDCVFVMLHLRDRTGMHRVQVGALPMARQKLTSVHLRAGGEVLLQSALVLKQDHLKINPTLVWWFGAESVYQPHRS